MKRTTPAGSIACYLAGLYLGLVFRMPIDIIKPLLDLVEKSGKPTGANGSTRGPPAKETLLAA
jgi:hypothetical protein